jgi:penicillin-binding protein 1A
MRILAGRFYRYILAIWIGVASIYILGILYFTALAYNLFGLFGAIPDFEMIENPRSDQASEVYSEDNVLMGKYYRQNRSPVKYEEISPYLINALIATEDVRFEEHSGIDFWRLGGIVVSMGSTGGASTITQQVAKNLFETRGAESKGYLHKIPGVSMLVTKTKEWFTAILIEKSYTKKEILEMYFNTVEFGSNAFGINTAAKNFFDKHPSQLNVQEAAMLVGVLKAPTKYSPFFNYKNAMNRRNTVLEQMEKYHFLTSSQCEKLKKTKIETKRGNDNQLSGVAPYFRVELQKFLEKWAKENKRDLYKDGLRIYTTINTKMQKYAEEAVIEQLNEKQPIFYQEWKWLRRNPWVDDNDLEIPNFIEKEAKKTERYRKLVAKYGENSPKIKESFETPVPMRIYMMGGIEKDTIMTPYDSIRHYKHFLQAGFVVVEPQTGYVRAWVGGHNFKHFQFDHVNQGKRQPGSTFKPVVYCMALDNGYTPCSQFIDAPVTIGNWTPGNSGAGYTGRGQTLRQGLSTSNNFAVVTLMKHLGPKLTIEYARNLGIKSPLDTNAALCLGTSDVNLLELTGVYTTFVNLGKRAEPSFVTRIEDRYGNTVAEFPPKFTRPISADVAYQMIHMLKGSLEAGGTSASLHSFGITKDNEIMAKTGTTQKNADAVFVGSTPNLTASVWVGGDTRATRFFNMAYGQGAVLALPVWGKFFTKLYNDPVLTQKYPKGAFDKPEDLSVELDCGKMELLRKKDLENED